VSDATAVRMLTQELLGQLGPTVRADQASITEAVRQIPRSLANLAVPRPGGGPFRLTDHDVRLALTTTDLGWPNSPFAWSARTARRGLGSTAVRALVVGDARTPTEGVRGAIAAALRSVRQGDRPASAMDHWLAGLPPASVAVVQANAVTWATRLWTALDWSSFETPPVIGRDHWWDSPHSSLLAIRSRAEVRSQCSGGRDFPFSVHLVVLGGSRRPAIKSELSVVAMVEALRSPPTLPPGRIVGWWPDSGHLVKVEVDGAAVEAGVAAVTQTMAQMSASAARIRSAPRAAA
jgi:hypothetical protein